MNIAIYARVSTDKQENANQLNQLREFAGKNQWKIVAEYVDTVSGGGKKRRSAFDAMMTDASKRRFDLLLFWSLDRLTREGALATMTYLKRLSDYGVKFRSYTEQYLDSLGVFGDAIVGLLATLAKQERQRISERVIAGLERARKQGKQIGRLPRVPMDVAKLRRLAASNTSIWQMSRELKCSRTAVRTALSSLSK